MLDVSWALRMLMKRPTYGVESLWNLVLDYSASQCSDPRDRVFGLVELANDTSLEPFRPDYSKSHTQVIIQLLEHQAKLRKLDNSGSRRDGPRGDYKMEDAFAIVRSYGSGPDVCDITTMLHRRRDIYHSSKRSLDPPLHDLSRALGSQRRIDLDVYSYCRVQRKRSGRYGALRCWQAPLIRKELNGRYPIRNLLVEQESQSEALRICDPSGTVMALADKKTRSGDVLLFLHDSAEFRAHIPGLVVRRANKSIYMVVGQFIYDPGVRPCPLIPRSRVPGVYSCECRGDDDLHSSSLGFESWRVEMSAEDLLLFAAQDIKPNTAELDVDRPMSSTAAQLEGRWRRLVTSVTDEPSSSYAVCRVPDEQSLAWAFRRTKVPSEHNDYLHWRYLRRAVHPYERSATQS